MIEYVSGDIFASNAAALVNPVNCVGVMGKGLALQFKTRYPGIFLEYRDACRAGLVAPGRMFVSKAVTWLDLFFQEPWSGSTLVVTHHAPSYLSQHPRFANSTIGGAFCSNLDDRILEWQPDVWIHGHLHDPVDYRIGKTRVLCNPWGYPDEGREAEFRIVEVGESTTPP